MLMNLSRQSFTAILVVMTALTMMPFQARADEVLWQSGKNLHIRLVDEESGARPNDQPVELNANDITKALQLFEIYNKNFIKSNEVLRVFSIQQARLLGQYLAEGLRKARPDQDIEFALAKRERGFLSIETTHYMAGRIFYVDGKLNIIIGDYNRPADRFQERANESMGAGSEIKYYFDHGSRDSASGFDKGVIAQNGITTRDGRSDWFVIDVDEASRAYLTEQRQSREADSGGAADSAAVREEAAKLARERREMRIEMARMRKEMQESKDSRTVEERLKALESLKQQGLISGEEYKRKRQDILNDL